LFAATPALPPDAQARVVAEANKALEVPYVLGGRLRTAADGLDCQGLVFFALQPVSRCGWRSLSVMPTVSVKGELGVPVPGASPVRADALADVVATLEPGDVVWWLDTPENSAEPALTTLDGAAVWVWHVGLYVGEGKVIIGDHLAGKVVQEDLVAYTRAHYAGVFVTRMKNGPAPTRCRTHAPMTVGARTR
jgi:cell wall-associated NlpC family hydrolase